jgi:hypothetical protein
MRREVVVAITSILVVASLGIGYLAGSSARTTETMTSFRTYLKWKCAQRLLPAGTSTRGLPRFRLL